MAETASSLTPQAQRSAALLDAVIASRSNAEDRPEQHLMAALVANAAKSSEPLVVQAGTGTGKSLAYLCGGVGAGTRLVVSTATRQLSDQLISSDVPLVSAVSKKAIGKSINAVALKGRSNYLCLAKVDELRELDEKAPGPPPELEEDSLDLGIELPPPKAAAPAKIVVKPTSADLRALNELLDWAEEGPGTGDRAQAPAVSDKVWWQVSTDAAGCPGARACPFGEDCLAEKARAAARQADVVIINHALLAQDLISPNPLFSDFELIVVDEVHELEGYLSSAWGHEIFSGSVDRIVTAAARRVPKSNEAATVFAQAAVADANAVSSALREMAIQRWPDELPSGLDGPLASLQRNGSMLTQHLGKIAKAAKDADKPDEATAAQSAQGQLAELIESIEVIRRPDRAVVRWSEAGRDDAPGVLRAAPLEVGRKFRERVGHRSLVATSATASIAGDFQPVAAELGLTVAATDAEGEPLIETWQGVDVGSPFDYEKQAILYIPTHMPEPVGKERADHTAAVLDELVELVTAAGGRTLALFTTTYAARNAAKHLKSNLMREKGKPAITVLAHGELPAGALAEEFADDETSVLCATMGMWAGLNVAGPSCTLVVIDKIPFMPMDDPLAAARRLNADEAGRNGFREVFVNHAALMLTQGAGRLIRSREDRGVVAILDPRLRTKGYGPIMLRSLPPMWPTSDSELVRKALQRLAEAASS